MIQRFYAWYTVIYQFKRIFALFTGELSHNVCNTTTSISKESDISTKETYMCPVFQNAIRWHNFFSATGNQAILRLSESGKNTKVRCRQSQQKCGVATQKTRKSAFFGTTLCRKVNVYAVLTTT